MPAPVWLDKALMLALYEDVVAASGGAAGLRDEGLLESALARPTNRYLYEQVSSVLELAATYAVGIASNHPFLDGNKRMAFIALGQFLADNGIVLTATPDDATAIILGVAKGEVSIDDLSAWLETRTLRPPQLR
ncbi:MAG: type II toxin-antitoxin system death-on-curing family toxin [Phenylobacterium sp.]|uniref:type II toxin-antitoxin system death-on-curing family toxin n=1 Tax=Phenylobacterium sp. TaxID=1871053 RepID=UPI00121A2FDC|nr:type II toxin-antitoxin system death-on-curing family toxin [Phenylobacterium sp.]TAL29907.1 MAG: type II toxin-antitoxin system death-on-curing family toxin [Phenylobacterium sp.]